jgi:hypothetical protein
LWEKAKWAVAGTSLTLEAALIIVAEVSMSRSTNVCRANALNNALIEYAENAGSTIEGAVESDLFNNASAEVPEEFDRLYGAFE